MFNAMEPWKAQNILNIPNLERHDIGSKGDVEVMLIPNLVFNTFYKPPDSSSSSEQEKVVKSSKDILIISHSVSVWMRKVSPRTDDRRNDIYYYRLGKTERLRSLNDLGMYLKKHYFKFEPHTCLRKLMGQSKKITLFRKLWLYVILCFYIHRIIHVLVWSMSSLAESTSWICFGIDFTNLMNICLTLSLWNDSFIAFVITRSLIVQSILQFWNR